MKKISFFLLVFFIQFSSYGQSKRQQKFMVMNVSYEDASVATLITLEEFLGINLMTLNKGIYGENNTTIIKEYKFNTSLEQYKGDLYFIHDGKNLIINLKNFQYYDAEKKDYMLALLGVNHIGIKSSLRKKIVEYINQVLSDNERLDKGKNLGENIKKKQLIASEIPVPKARAVQQGYAKKGIQFNINQEKFLVGGNIDIIFSQSIEPSAVGFIYIVDINTPRGNIVHYNNRIIKKDYIHSSNGKITLKLPREPGEYEVRYALNKTNVIKEEVAYKAISVEMPITEISLSKTNFVPGEAIRANWSTEIDLNTLSHIGIVANDVPHGSSNENQRHKINGAYLKGKKGLSILKAPSEEGTYTIRLSEYYSGKELASKTFTVSNAVVELKLEKKTFNAGEKIKILFNSSSASQNQAWIGILPSDIPHGNTEENKKHWINSDNVTGKKEAVIYLVAPTKAGNYDIRMNYYGSNYSYSNGSELASVSIVVSADEKSQKTNNLNFKYSSINNISESLALGGSVLNEKVILNNINFNTGSAELTEKSKSNLKELVTLLTNYPNLKLEISGHTDSTGNEDSNLELSKKRAQSVVVYLIMNNAKPSSLSYEGYGQYKPIYNNKTSQGKLKNRRVEFQILNQ